MTRSIAESIEPILVERLEFVMFAAPSTLEHAFPL